MAVLFGGQGRALVLGVLASANGPLSGYRVAKLTGGQKIKVSAELKRLAEVGIVRQGRNAEGRTVWDLVDPDLRQLLRRRIRISFDQDWDKGRPGSGEAVDRLLREIEESLPDANRNPRFYRPKGWKPNAEFREAIGKMVRPAEKDRILRKYGARTSYREGKRQ